MHNRLIELIQYKTMGVQTDFAELMGWSPQYLNKLTREGSIGIKPVVALLERFPELNARWLLLGEGAMITGGAEKVKEYLFRLLELEKFIPVMSPDEVRRLSDGNLDFEPETVEKWRTLLDEKNRRIEEMFSASYKRQEELCRQNKAK